ncbi:MAG: hypothetical protein KDC66_14765 [Phaeodactylibacter sp.]|nr:hypothetical protein [Phaeodactylibacter sp.]MCB9275853.1 hypothetical protein [Lewinellaceae bacterium]
MSFQKHLFYAIAAILFLANVLVMNDYTSLWDGAETWVYWQALQGAQVKALPEAILSLVYQHGFFWFRLPGAMLLLIAFPVFAWATGRLWGKETVLGTLLVLAASLFVPNLAKLASGDVWALVLQWLAYAALLRYLKQPRLLWQLMFYLLFFLAVWVQAIQSLVFLVGYSVYLYFAHPQGRNLQRLQPWLAGPAVAAVLYFAGVLDLDDQGFMFGFRTGRYLLWNFIGLLPFWGFWMAGLWESITRARKGEELARINLGAVIFALLGHSLALQGILALLVAKQWQAYSRPAYPHKPIVLAGAVLHLVGILFAAILLLIAGFHEFGPVGFRAAAAAAGPYWVLSFVGVVGLLGGRRRYMAGGPVLAGLLVTTFFWLQLNPLLESRRSWPEQLVSKAVSQVQQARGMACLVISPVSEPVPKLAAYALEAFPATEWVNTESAARASLESLHNTVVFMPEEWAKKLAPGKEITARAEGWDDRLKGRVYVLLLY